MLELLGWLGLQKVKGKPRSRVLIRLIDTFSEQARNISPVLRQILCCPNSLCMMRRFHFGASFPGIACV